MLLIMSNNILDLETYCGLKKKSRQIRCQSCGNCLVERKLKKVSNLLKQPNYELLTKLSLLIIWSFINNIIMV